MFDIVQIHDVRHKMLADARRMAASDNRAEALFGCDILQTHGDASDQLLAFRTRKNFWLARKMRFTAWFNVLHGELLWASAGLAVVFLIGVMCLAP